MQPGINNDNFGEESRDSQRNESQQPTSHEKKDSWDKKDGNKEDVNHEEKVNDVHDNDTIDNSWDADSKTYNQNENSWKEENGEGAKASNAGSQDDNLNTNEEAVRSPSYNFIDDETREASAGDYIDSDRETYNWNNDRFRWSEPEDEQS